MLQDAILELYELIWTVFSLEISLRLAHFQHLLLLTFIDLVY